MMNMFRELIDKALFVYENYKVIYYGVFISGVCGGMIVWEFIRQMISQIERKES